MKMNTRSLGLVGLAFLVPAAWAQPSAAAVEVASAQMRNLAPALRAAGQVQSRAAVEMSAADSGRIEWVAEAGTWLEKGKPIARLDDTELRLQQAEQQARVRRGELASSQARRELERLQGSGDAVSQFQLDQAESNHELAISDLEIARATLKQIQERLARTEIRAPFDGVVSERVRSAGEEVSRGEIVARLLDPEDLEIRSFVPLRHLRSVRPGHVVNLRGERSAVEATVRAVVPAGDARSQSFEVLISVPREANLAPGQTVRVDMPLGTPAERLSVPRDALIIRTDGVFVMRVNGEQKAERVPVNLGVADGEWIEVLGELLVGDAVIVRGGESLRGGEAVKVLNGQAS